MNIMPKHKSAVCEMPLNGAKDCVVVESLRCPYCLAAVEIRQGDNWTTYWCQQHGPIEHPISFSDTTLAGRLSSPAPFHRRVSASWFPATCFPLSRVAGFLSNLPGCTWPMSRFRVTSLITVRSGASREGLINE